MTKFLLPLLFLLPSGAYAIDKKFDLNAVTLEILREFPPALSPAVAVPRRADPQPEEKYFNAYILKAIDYLYKNYGLLGYDINSILTHDITYNTSGIVPARRAPLTMCVAAQMEIILTAYEIYAGETGDFSVYYYLPKRSFEGLSVTDLKGHIWVNPKFNANGTADALINFGMGEREPFENLRPGDFVNINRANRTGHAVTFIGYINKTGKILPRYDAGAVVGFKYFSSQGRLAAGEGGLDYRYAVFSKFGCPEMPYKRDCEVIYSADQRMLNTGTMLAPRFWTHTMPQASSETEGETTELNHGFFNGLTTDD
ncbi:MAG TPA: hypothetical protein DCS63_08760 [Elusimicrobia bacterium]|nr:hypothetical protein [Elusimicrobiota bacterium]